MKAFLYCGRPAKGLPLRDLPEALLPFCNVPLLAHILRFLEKNGFTEAVLLEAGEQVREFAGTLPLQIPLCYAAATESLRTDAPALVLRRLCLPDWNTGELQSLCQDESLRLLRPDGSDTCAELHPTGAALTVPEASATAVLSAFTHADSAETYRRLQLSLLQNGRMGKLRIGAGLHLGKHTRVDERSVIGNDCIIGDHAVLEECCLGDGVQIGAGCVLRRCVIGCHALVDRDAVLEDTALGQGEILPPRSAAPVQRRIVLHGEDGICEGLPRWNHAGTALKAGAAMAVLGERLAIGCSTEEAKGMASAAIAGAVCRGAQVWDAGICALPQLIHAAGAADCSAMLWVQGDTHMKLLPFGTAGLPLSSGMVRRLRQALAAEVSTKLIPGGKIVDAAPLHMLWEAQCRKLLPELPFEIEVSCGDPLLRRTAQRLFGGGSGERIVLALTEDGTGASAFSQNSGMVRHEQLLLLSLLSMRERGEALALPADFHPAAEQFAAKCGGRILRVHTAQRTPAAARLYASQGVCMDGVMLFAHVLRVLHMRQINLARAAGLLPKMYTAERRLSTTLGRQAVEKLCRTNPDPAVQLSLPENGRLVRLLAHADTMEAASEICGFWMRKLKAAEDDGGN